MTYQKDRDEFLHIIQQEGLSYTIATKLLAVAQCNGDWPADNGERKVEWCECGSGFHPSAFKRMPYMSEGNGGRTYFKRVCPDCYVEEKVKSMLAGANNNLYAGRDWREEELPVFKPVFQGDPRGCVLKIQVPSGRTNDWGKEGICVPVRER